MSVRLARLTQLMASFAQLQLLPVRLAFAYRRAMAKSRPGGTGQGVQCTVLKRYCLERLFPLSVCEHSTDADLEHAWDAVLAFIDSKSRARRSDDDEKRMMIAVECVQAFHTSPAPPYKSRAGALRESLPFLAAALAETAAADPEDAMVYRLIERIASQQSGHPISEMAKSLQTRPTSIRR